MKRALGLNWAGLILYLIGTGIQPYYLAQVNDWTMPHDVVCRHTVELDYFWWHHWSARDLLPQKFGKATFCAMKTDKVLSHWGHSLAEDLDEGDKFFHIREGSEKGKVLKNEICQGKGRLQNKNEWKIPIGGGGVVGQRRVIFHKEKKMLENT